MAKLYKKLTRPNIRKSRPGESITERGICFERLLDGDGRYSVNVMVDGQRIHRVVGRESDRTTRSQAEQLIEQLRTEARHDRLRLPKGRKIAIPFKQAAHEYLKRLEESNGKDMKAKKRKSEMHLIPFFGTKPLDKIVALDIERYKKFRLQQKAIMSSIKAKPVTTKDSCVTPATINRELAVLSHLFNKAIEWSWLSKPIKIVRLKENNGRITYLTADQASRLIDCSKEDQNSQVYLFVMVALNTSMRLSEILSIRTEHVDVQNRRVFIPKAKAGMREQPITDQLASLLETTLKSTNNEQPWLFPSAKSKSGHTVNINKPFRRIVKAAGLDPDVVVRHTMRHTAITHLVQAGVDLPTIKRISGHKTLIMVERYAHANGNHIDAAMDKLNSRLKYGT